MAISRSQLAKELEPGLHALFGLEYSRWEQDHAQIFTAENSSRAFEENPFQIIPTATSPETKTSFAMSDPKDAQCVFALCNNESKALS